MTSLILIAIAGIMNAVMDILHVKAIWNKSIWAEMDPDKWWVSFAGPQGWKNKWKDGSPSKGERFWGSSRWLVFLTDGWHLFQFLWGSLFAAAVVLYEPLWTIIPGNPWLIILADFATFRIAYLVIFTIFYDHIFKSNN